MVAMRNWLDVLVRMDSFLLPVNRKITGTVGKLNLLALSSCCLPYIPRPNVNYQWSLLHVSFEPQDNNGYAMTVTNTMCTYHIAMQTG
jgi:hypothetical protein